MRTRTRTILAGLVLVAGLLGGVAWATGTISSVVAADGTINGCYRAINGDDNAGKGQLRVVADGETCKKNERAIQWSQEGPKGDRGLQGPVGPQGVKGDRGAPGVTGATGAPGAQGAKGEKGDPGAKGESGAPGTNGLDGRNGADGKDGAAGSNGAKGDTGPAGPKGDAGSSGLLGPKGDTGVQGPPGPSSGVVRLDDLSGVPCNNSTGTIQVSYANGTGDVSMRCQASTYYTLTLNVSGGWNEPVSIPYSYSCGALNASTCTGYNTVIFFRPQVITGNNGINCSQTTCTYSLPAGTQVNLSALYPNSATWSGASHATPFTLTANKTVTVT